MSKIFLKSGEDLILMREACRRVALVLEAVVEKIAPGISTFELDSLAKVKMEELDVTSSSYGYRSGSKVFPGHICVSVGDELVHGIGKKDRVLKEGDIVSLDVAGKHNGFVGDNARTVEVGESSVKAKKLLQTTKEALMKGIECATVGNRIGDISNAIQQHVEKNGFSVVRELVGHGIGREMHEEPQVPNYGNAGRGQKLLEGMTLAIEPMVNAGSRHVVFDNKDGWTVRTKDGSLCAHFEHTILITKAEPEILTKV